MLKINISKWLEKIKSWVKSCKFLHSTCNQCTGIHGSIIFFLDYSPDKYSILVDDY